MVYLLAENISHSYGNRKVINNVSLSVGKGELVCLLGPSGCGKSTLLRLLAGLENPDEAKISMGNKIVTGKGKNIPVEKRKVGMVFQNPSLFPHLNVLDNILFGIKKRDKNSKNQAMKLLSKVGMDGYQNSYTNMLSGGQQQRIAIIRALAPKPKIMMMDEPFANLDTVLRKKIRKETANILKDEGVATILVTHDPEEALQVADRIYVMQDGKIIQSGTPHDLYNNPANSFVAGFFGELNHLDVRVEDNKIHTAFGQLDVQKVACNNLGKDVCELIADGTPVKVYIRPEALTLTKKKEGSTEAVVNEVRFMGFAAIVHVCLCDKNIKLRVRVAGNKLPDVGDKVYLSLNDNQAFIFKD